MGTDTCAQRRRTEGRLGPEPQRPWPLVEVERHQPFVTHRKCSDGADGKWTSSLDTRLILSEKAKNKCSPMGA